jgi:hypothetical protein
VTWGEFREPAPLPPRTDLKAKHPRAALLDLSKFIQPDMALARLDEKFPQENFPTGVCGGDSFGLNQKILAAAYDAIDTAQNADLVFRVRNSDRSVGATVDYKLTSNDRVTFAFQYSSFDGRFIVSNVNFNTVRVPANGFTTNSTQGAVGAGTLNSNHQERNRFNRT